jgi:hypothetical protein
VKPNPSIIAGVLELADTAPWVLPHLKAAKCLQTALSELTEDQRIPEELRRDLLRFLGCVGSVED